MHCKEMLGNGKTDSLGDIAALSDGISSHRQIQKCRKICGLGCVNRARARARVTQPSPCIFFCISVSHHARLPNGPCSPPDRPQSSLSSPTFFLCRVAESIRNRRRHTNRVSLCNMSSRRPLNGARGRGLNLYEYSAHMCPFLKCQQSEWEISVDY